MPDDKKLIISTAYDASGGQQFLSFLDKAIGKAKEFGQVLISSTSSLFGGGTVGAPRGRAAQFGQPGQQALSQANMSRAVNEQVTALRNLSTVSKQTFETTTSSVSRTIREIDTLTGKLQNLINLQAQIGGGRIGPPGPGGVAGPVGGFGPILGPTGAPIAAGMAGVAGGAAPPSSTIPLPPSGVQEPPQRGFDPFRTILGGGGRRLTTATAAFRLGGMAIAGAEAIASELLAQPTRFIGAQARRAEIIRPMLEAGLGGDVTRQFFLKRALQTRQEDILQELSPEMREAIRVHGGLAAVGRSILGGRAPGPGPLQAVMPQEVQTEVLRRIMEHGRLEEQAAPLTAMALQRFHQQVPTSLSMMRMMGLSVEARPPGRAQPINVLQQFLDPFRRVFGVEGGEQMAMQTFQDVMQVGGRRAAQQLSLQAAMAQAAGLSGAGQMAGIAAITGQAAGAPTPGIAGGQFLGALFGGNLDITARSRIGQFAAQSLISGAPMTSGLGFLGALQAGAEMDPTGGLRFAQFLPGAMAGFGRLMGGQIDPFQAGRNVINAMMSAPGASLQAQTFLATRLDPRMTMDVMAGEAVPETLRARGITREQITGMFGRTLQTIEDRLISGGATDTPELQALRALRGVGGDPRKIIGRKFGGVSAVDAFSSILTDAGVVATDEEARSLAQTLMGTGGKARRGRIPDIAKGTAEAEVTKAAAEGISKLTQEVDNNRQEIKSNAAELVKFSDVLNKSAGNMETTAQSVVIALENMTAALNKTTVALGGPAGQQTVQDIMSRYRTVTELKRAMGAASPETRPFFGEAIRQREQTEKATPFTEGGGI